MQFLFVIEQLNKTNDCMRQRVRTERQEHIDTMYCLVEGNVDIFITANPVLKSYYLI